MNDVTWKDPPGPRRIKSDVGAWEKQLRSRPGRWAMLRAYATSNSAAGARHHLAAKWGPDFEVQVRSREVYARYIGKPMRDVRGGRT